MPLNSSPPEKNASARTGTLYVVATPIGNRDDITLRALKTLGAVDLVAAEDTRHTAKLMTMHDISARLVSFQEYNEAGRIPELIDKLTVGKSIALVSDAGTPSVSDPGFRLVTAAVEKGIPVVPIPGVSAAITAISVSGLPTDSFAFIGFPAKKKGARRRQLTDLAHSPRTLVFYESPRRIIALVREVREIFGDRRAVLGREMTKLHEEFIRSRLSDIEAALAARETVKGECTLLVAGAEEAEIDPDPTELADDIRHCLAKGDIRPTELARVLAERHGLGRKIVYQKILEIRNDSA